jgi:hypothetical protein
MKKNIHAEFDSLMEFLEEGIVDGEQVSKKLGIDHKDLELALSTWRAVKDNDKIERKGIISIGRVVKVLEDIL